MSLPTDPAQKASTTAQNVTSSSVSTGFTMPVPVSTANVAASSLQFKPLQTSTPSTSAPVSSSTTATGFPLGGDLLNQLKGHIASNAPSTNVLGGLTGEKKLGPGTTSLSSGTTQISTQPTTSTTQASTSFLSSQAAGDKQVSQMTYEEFESTVNKLIDKLADNSEEFTKIARELNEWDKAINENYEKLLLLTETVKTVKSAQLKLTNDLDFIAIEHKDFESIIGSCEKEVENYNFTHHSRHDVYQKAVSVDTQVRRMCEELREVIEHLNDRLRFCESDDPVMQIGKVLNAHMESLKWVDESTTQIHDYINYLSQIQEQMKKKLPQIGN